MVKTKETVKQLLLVAVLIDVSLGVRMLSHGSPWAPISLSFRIVNVVASFYSPSVPKLSLLLAFLWSYEKEIARENPCKSSAGIFISIKDVSLESVLVFHPLEDFHLCTLISPSLEEDERFPLLSCSYLSSTFQGSVSYSDPVGRKYTWWSSRKEINFKEKKIPSRV